MKKIVKKAVKRKKQQPKIVRYYFEDAPQSYSNGGNVKNEYNQLVGRVDDEYYFLNYIFHHSDGFKGATGDVIMPVSKSYYDYAMSREGIIERYIDSMGEDEWIDVIGIDREEYEDEDKLIEAIEDGIYDLFLAGQLHPFEEVDYYAESEMRKLPQFQDSDEFPIFEVVGGGRIFSDDIAFDDIYNQELYDKIKEVEGFKEGGELNKMVKIYYNSQIPFYKKDKNKYEIYENTPFIVVPKSQVNEVIHDHYVEGDWKNYLVPELMRTEDKTKYSNGGGVGDYELKSEDMRATILAIQRSRINPTDVSPNFAKEMAMDIGRSITEKEAIRIAKGFGYEGKYANGGGVKQSNVYEINGIEYLVSEPTMYNGKYTGWNCYKAVFEMKDGERHLNYDKTKTFGNREWFKNEDILKGKIVEDYFADYFAKGGGVDEVKYFYIKGRNEYAPKKLKDTYAEFYTENDLIEYLNKWKGNKDVSFNSITKVYNNGESKDVTDFYLKNAYSKGGGVRKVGGKEYPFGSAWALEHNKHNKSEKYEVSPASRKDKKYANGDIVQEDAQSINTIALLNGVRKSENTFQEFKRKLTQIIKRNGYRMPTEKAFEIAYETNQFANGGGIMADGRIVLRTFNGVGGNKNKTYKLIKDDRDSDGKPYYTLIEEPSGNIMAQGDSFEEVNGYANLMSGKFSKGGGVRQYAGGGGVGKKYYWITMDRDYIDEYINYASRMNNRFEGEIYTQAPNKVAFDTENDMFAFTSMIENHNIDNDLEEGDEEYIHYEELFNGEPRENIFDKISSKNYAGGGIIKVGDNVVITDDSNENYYDYLDRNLIVTNIRKDRDGDYLYDLEDEDSGEELPFSFNENEIELFAKGGGVRQYANGGKLGEDLQNYSDYNEFYDVVFEYIKREENLTEAETKNICIVNESIIEAEFDSGSSPRFTGDVILGYLSNERGYMAKGGEAGIPEWSVTITSVDNDTYDWIGFAKDEDEALYLAEQEAGFDSVETGINMITDEKGNKIEYAGGGEVEDWMEEALESLIEETGFDDLKITYVHSKEFYCEGSDAEYRVFETEEDAEETAIERVREDLEEIPEAFNQEWLSNFLEADNFFREILEEQNYGYATDIMTEDDDLYANRLIREMVDWGIMTEEEAMRSDAEQIASDNIQDFVNLLTDDQCTNGAFEYYANEFGKEEAYNLALQNNLIDFKEASENAVMLDGIGHFLSSFDGQTIYLSKNAVAYRTN